MHGDHPYKNSSLVIKIECQGSATCLIMCVEAQARLLCTRLNYLMAHISQGSLDEAWHAVSFQRQHKTHAHILASDLLAGLSRNTVNGRSFRGASRQQLELNDLPIDQRHQKDMFNAVLRMKLQKDKSMTGVGVRVRLDVKARTALLKRMWGQKAGYNLHWQYLEVASPTGSCAGALGLSLVCKRFRGTRRHAWRIGTNSPFVACQGKRVATDANLHRCASMRGRLVFQLSWTKHSVSQSSLFLEYVRDRVICCIRRFHGVRIRHSHGLARSFAFTFLGKMGLTFTKLFSRLFSKKEMRILMVCAEWPCKAVSWTARCVFR
jgi:hypothetical protein